MQISLQVLCLYRLTHLEPQLEKLDHYFQLQPVTGLKNQCYTFMTTLDNIVNMIRCVECLKAKKNSLIAFHKSQEITKEHCNVRNDNVCMYTFITLRITIACGRCSDLDFVAKAWK